MTDTQTIMQLADNFAQEFEAAPVNDFSEVTKARAALHAAVEAMAAELEQVHHLRRILETEWQDRFDAQTQELEAAKAARDTFENHFLEVSQQYCEAKQQLEAAKLYAESNADSFAQMMQKNRELQALTDMTQEMGLYEEPLSMSMFASKADYKAAQPVAQPVAWVDMCDGVPTGSPRFWQEHNHDEVPLYAASVMYKNAPDLDTTQERVNKLEKSNQMLVDAIRAHLDSSNNDDSAGDTWAGLMAALAAVEKP